MNNETIPYYIRMSLARGREISQKLLSAAMYASLRGVPVAPKDRRIVSYEGLPPAGVYVQLVRRNGAWQVTGDFYNSKGERYDGNGLCGALREQIPQQLIDVPNERFDERIFKFSIPIKGRTAVRRFPQNDASLSSRAGEPLRGWLTKKNKAKY